MKRLNNTARWWLEENGYEDIAALIDGIVEKWKKAGNKQRRNWWDILAGDKNGASRIVAGVKIPVVRAAQIRKGMQITKNALKRSRKETPVPPPTAKGRWPAS